MDRALPSPPSQPKRLAYLGSPELAVRPLQALVDAGYEIPLVVSRADRRRGRGAGLSPSPVKAAAQQLGLAVSDDPNALAEVEADLAVVVAYGRLIKLPLLQRLPFVNLHFSLLPRWRGAAPVERALLAGDTTTGVCVMALEEGLDTGGVYRQAEVAITEDTTLDALRHQLVELGTGLLLDCLANGFGSAQPQQGEPLYAAKLDPAELQLDWALPAARLLRVVRVGRAFTTFRGKRLLVHDAAVAAVGVGPDGAGVPAAGATPAPGSLRLERGQVQVATGAGWLALREVQPEGRGRVDAVAWRNGARPGPDELLGA